MGKSILDYDPIVKIEKPEPVVKTGKWDFNAAIEELYKKNKNTIIKVFISKPKTAVIRKAAVWKGLKLTYKNCVINKYIYNPDDKTYIFICDHI